MDNNAKKKYKVTVTEIYQRDFYFEAENETQAEKLAEDGWVCGRLMLDADRFEIVKFNAEELKVPVRKYAHER